MSPQDTKSLNTGLQTIRPDWPVSACVQVHSTTRTGGESAAPYDSLNLGLHVQDEAPRVRLNRQHVSQCLDLPAEPLWLNQVHGNSVIRFPEKADNGSVNEIAGATPADGAWTEQPGVVLAVLTADCLPVVISNTAGSAVAVAHAGWRGLAAGVLQQVLKQFASAEVLHAWLGPAIGPTAFEVGDVVRDAFLRVDARHASSFAPSGSSGKYRANLYSLAEVELNRERKIQISGGSYCTLNDTALFFSHRRDGVHSGRMATLAWIR